MLKVLIVEDDPKIANLVRQLLELEGFTSAVSIDIEGAWEVVTIDRPDAAIVDISLAQGQSGFDLIERVRASENFKDLPIVVFTGHPEELVIQRIDSLGCQFLAKPFSSAALMDRLQVALRGVGKGPTQRPVQAVLLLERYRIEGTLHMPADLTRFSDGWEATVRDVREYIPVTDARVLVTPSGDEVARAEFMQVRKADILAAFGD